MNKKYEISFDIYPQASVKNAIEDFSDVAIIQITPAGISIEAESGTESDEVFREFMNYLLSI
jgi:hypothetical protein